MFSNPRIRHGMIFLTDSCFTRGVETTNQFISSKSCGKLSKKKGNSTGQNRVADWHPATRCKVEGWSCSGCSDGIGQVGGRQERHPNPAKYQQVSWKRGINRANRWKWKASEHKKNEKPTCGRVVWAWLGLRNVMWESCLVRNSNFHVGDDSNCQVDQSFLPPGKRT